MSPGRLLASLTGKCSQFCHRGNICHQWLTSHQIRFLRFAATNEKWKMLDLEQMDGGTID